MNNVHEIEIKLEKEWIESLDKTFKQKNKEVKIDGFRKGSAPKDIYIKKFGLESLYMDAVNDSINVAYKKLLSENKLVPIIEPTVDVTGVSDANVIFKFTVITKPDVTLGEYKNLKIAKEKIEVTEKEVTDEIEELRNKLAEIIVKENGVITEKDTAIIDFKGYVDGELLEGGSGENFPLEIGSHSFIPGFEEGIMGLATGDSKKLELTFPENYVEDLKNKDVTFDVTIKEVKTRLLPEVNEEFFKDLGYDDITSESQLKKLVEQELHKRKELENEDAFIEKCLEKAASNLKVNINSEIIDEEVHRMIDQYQEQLHQQGMDIETYYQITGTDHETLHKQMVPEAEKRVKYRYLIEAISEIEKVDFTEEEVDIESKKIAEHYGITVEELIKSYGSLDIVKYDMKMHKALEILKENN